MERQKPTTSIRHNDEFSKALIESYGRWMGGQGFGWHMQQEETYPEVQKKGGEDDFSKKDPKANAAVADPAVVLNNDLRTGKGIKQSHGAQIKYTNVVAKEAYGEKPEKEEKGEKKHKEGKAEEEKEMKKEAKDYLPGSQEKLDANKNGKLDSHDFALLRARKGKKSVKEMWQKAAEVAEGKKVEIEIMPNVNTPNDPEPPSGRKVTDDIKKKLKKEEVEPLEEKKLSKAETAKKEKFVKGMKKRYGSFKSKYGERAKEVMYATATKMGKKAA